VETSDILEVFEQSSDEDVCNYDNGIDIDISVSEDKVC
jgi:hypothetical protein